MEHSDLGPAISGTIVQFVDPTRLTVAAYLARFKRQSRIHTESDLRGYLGWCDLRGLEPLTATPPI